MPELEASEDNTRTARRITQIRLPAHTEFQQPGDDIAPLRIQTGALTEFAPSMDNMLLQFSPPSDPPPQYPLPDPPPTRPLPPLPGAPSSRETATIHAWAIGFLLERLDALTEQMLEKVEKGKRLRNDADILPFIVRELERTNDLFDLLLEKHKREVGVAW